MPSYDEIHGIIVKTVCQVAAIITEIGGLEDFSVIFVGSVAHSKAMTLC
jgi:hypothetical protein